MIHVSTYLSRGHTFEGVPVNINAAEVQVLLHDAQVLALSHRPIHNLHNLEHCKLHNAVPVNDCRQT